MTSLARSTPGPLPGAGVDGVLLVRSELTDVRGLTGWLADKRIAYEDLVLHMSDAEQRRRFQELSAETGWRTLPQVFVDGRFVGGEAELRKLLDAPAAVEGRMPTAMKALSALGYLSALPFLAALLALLLTSAPLTATVEYLLVAYGAVILSFLGAVHWGRVLDAEPENRVPVVVGLLAVMPALVGWGTLLLPAEAALPLQALLFVAIYAVDRVALASLVLGGWYVRLRNRLTSLVVMVLLCAWLVILLR